MVSSIGKKTFAPGLKITTSIGAISSSTSLKKLITIKDKQNELADSIGGGFKEASNYALTLLNKAAA